MRKIYLLFSLLVWISLFASDSLGYGEKDSGVQTHKLSKKVYTVRFLSLSKNKSHKSILESMPKGLRSQTRLIPSGKYLTAMFKERSTRNRAEKDLDYIKKNGYKDAYIHCSNNFFFKKKVKKQVIQEKPSKFTSSKIISKAKNAYKKGNYMQAIIFYEMLLSSGNTSRKVKNNLCYLYGRVGAFLQAEEIINSAKYSAKLIYAYAYGSATTGQENYYTNLSKYISYDKSGKLMLLSGYYFEMKHEQERSLTFYKMAYEQNPMDSYNLFAYARAEDILNHTNSALILYKKIVSTADASTQIYKEAEKRISQIGN